MQYIVNEVYNESVYNEFVSLNHENGFAYAEVCVCTTHSKQFPGSCARLLSVVDLSSLTLLPFVCRS
jgi:hypothetical protein